MLEDYSLVEAKYYQLLHVHIHCKKQNYFSPIEMLYKILLA